MDIIILSDLMYTMNHPNLDRDNIMSLESHNKWGFYIWGDPLALSHVYGKASKCYWEEEDHGD